MVDDAQLLEAWRAGDQRAGQALVRAHFNAVYRFFVNKAPTHAEDLTQETFLAVVEGSDRLRDPAALRAYLFGIARNRLFRHWRSTTDREPETCCTEELCGGDTSLSDALARHQEHKLLLGGLRRLPLSLQILLELSYFEGLTDRELAALEAIPIGTLKSRLRKARTELERAMAAVGSSEVLMSTTQDFAGWIASLRHRVDEAAEAVAI